MITVNVLNNNINKRFSKIFYSHEKAYNFVRKVNYSKNLTLLSVEIEVD